ncbi:MAG: hypothetical protein AAF297_02310 [Planctomycetota bacterium]
MIAPVELVVPEATAAASGGGAALVWMQWAMGAAALAALIALVVVRLARPVSAEVSQRRAVRAAAKGLGLSTDERETIEAMGAASQIEPSALLLSDRALRMARVASLANVTESGPMSSDRIRAACGKLGVD